MVNLGINIDHMEHGQYLSCAPITSDLGEWIGKANTSNYKVKEPWPNLGTGFIISTHPKIYNFASTCPCQIFGLPCLCAAQTQTPQPTTHPTPQSHPPNPTPPPEEHVFPYRYLTAQASSLSSWPTQAPRSLCLHMCERARALPRLLGSRRNLCWCCGLDDYDASSSQRIVPSRILQVMLWTNNILALWMNLTTQSAGQRFGPIGPETSLAKHTGGFHRKISLVLIL